MFLITGLFFFCAAATYAEATAMFPEAGGSSSFARRAFDELVSFFAARAQLAVYQDRPQPSSSATRTVHPSTTSLASRVSASPRMRMSVADR